ncbi:MAG TPA: hypothetical protein VI072_05190 [Polyangiaceae bacterium]
MFEHPQVSAQDRRAALLRNVHGWCGVLPLTLFLVLHVPFNALVLVDSSWFIGARTWKAGAPFLSLVEMVLVWLPLALHAGYGAWLTVSGSRPHPNRPNAATLLTRLSGFGALAFIAYHALEFRFTGTELDATDTAQKLYAELSATTASGVPLTGALYLLGLGITVFHAGFGTYWMYSAARPQADKSRVARWIGSCGALLFMVAAQTVVYCATGSRFFFW